MLQKKQNLKFRRRAWPFSWPKHRSVTYLLFLTLFIYNSCLDRKLAEVLPGIVGSESHYVNIMQISKDPDAVVK